MSARETEPNTKNILFTGELSYFGGLSNEIELAKKCPEEFKQDNPWSDYALKLFYSGGKISNWEWKSEDIQEQKTQITYFKCLLETFYLSHEDKTAVSGWMLSNMLNKVPEYIPNVPPLKI